MMYSAYKLNKLGDNIQPDVLLFLFGTSLLFHVQFYLLFPDLHIGFSRGRNGIPISFRIFRFIVIHTVKGFGIANKAEIDVFLEL